MQERQQETPQTQLTAQPAQLRELPEHTPVTPEQQTVQQIETQLCTEAAVITITDITTTKTTTAAAETT